MVTQKNIMKTETETIKESLNIIYNQAIDHSIETVESYYNFTTSPHVDIVLDKIIEDLKKLKS